MTRTQTAAPLPVAPVFAPPPTRIMRCDTCKADMPHSLTESGDAYVCSCGTAIAYYINHAPPTRAMG